MNKLIESKSPYLLQHAHNPVDWMPWGEEAFARAKSEDKPIFLSIGYSTCHWCHVMERESFENESVAAIMNAHFINIKVDREERPDVDRVYMTFVQATTGSGGWPLSAFLTPDLKPFFGGTYFPPDDAYGRSGFTSLLKRIHDAWQNDRDNILKSADSVTQSLQAYAAGEHAKSDAPAPIWDELVDRCFTHLQNSYDERLGGFGVAPKFPRPMSHDFLHRYFAATGEETAAQMSAHTLRKMAEGGLRDQLGGGFHRYSVDAQWIVPHFEKMLYDQAQLTDSYLEMAQLSGDPFFAEVARSTLDFVQRDMTHPGGGFYAAEDADSLPNAEAGHKKEGAFFVWTTKEIEAALGPERAAIFNEYYGVAPGGNAPAEGDPHGEFKGENILHVARPLGTVAKRLQRAPEEVAGVLQSARETLFARREERPRPHLDDKVIVAWNGLMISAFARAAQFLGDEEYFVAARHAADFIRETLYDEENRTLKRHFREGAADVPAFAEDYALLVRGLLDLYEATFDVAYLQWAETLNDTLIRDFYDEEEGGYFSAPPDPRVLLRMKEDYDGAEPSPNSAGTENNLRLAQLLDRADLKIKAEQTMAAFAPRVRQQPAAAPLLLSAGMTAATPPLHIVVAGAREDDATRELLRVVHEHVLPHRTLLLLDSSSEEFLASRLEWLRGLTKRDGQPAAYVCRDFACRAPVTSGEALRAELEG
jgi:uncharacterized protein YyaL (SSP411 family)